MTATDRPVVFRNRWDSLTVPSVGGWQPGLRVSVVIPAHNCQRTLDLTLAALSTQTYPRNLLEVVVVDDGSDPPIELPKIAPSDCRVVRVPEGAERWGPANARHTGALHSTGDILHWLDADMVVFPEHIEAQARWHHVVPYAVVLGYKRFVADGWSTPEEVAERGGRGDLDRLFDLDETEPHTYVEDLIERSHDLRDGHHLNFRAHVGATASVRRDLYLRVGGFDTDLLLGEDTELGYRLAQAGALFVPEPTARSWHMGPSAMMRTGDHLRRHNWPHLAHRMPQPRWFRNVRGRTWSLPLVTAVVEVGDHSFELVRACVDRILASDELDVSVSLVGTWSALASGRRPILDDPLLDLRLLAATYQPDPRVHLVEAAPETVFPSPYRLDVPARSGVSARTVRRLVEEADAWQSGLVRVLDETGKPEETVNLWRTAAVSRARYGGARDGAPLAQAVAEVHGLRWVAGADFGITDLSALPVPELGSPQPWRVGDDGDDAPGRFAGVYPGHAIPVAGLRSLLRATAYVARLAIARARRRLSRTWRRH